MANYSVLIIDDDIWMQRILAKTLSSYGFKNTQLASNGFDGISKAIEFQPNLIVLDILMPDLSGHLTLKILKTIKLTKEIPVVMVSALSDVENLGKAVKSGTAGFISKPFTRATVYEKLIDIYGREKLELIMHGKDIGGNNPMGFSMDAPTMASRKSANENPYDNLPQFEDLDVEQLYAGAKKSSLESASSDAQSKGGGSPSPSPVNSEKVSEHYQDDERRSIESIKALLLKGKGATGGDV